MYNCHGEKQKRECTEIAGSLVLACPKVKLQGFVLCPRGLAVWVHQGG